MLKSKKKSHNKSFHHPAISNNKTSQSNKSDHHQLDRLDHLDQEPSNNHKVLARWIKEDHSVHITKECHLLQL